MADLPNPDVTVTKTSDDHGAPVLDVMISREAGKGKSYRTHETSDTGMVGDIVRQIIRDPHTAEWLPSGKAK